MKIESSAFPSQSGIDAIVDPTAIDCMDVKFSANCENTDYREFCDYDASILNKDAYKSVCAPAVSIKFLLGEGDYCGRCRHSEENGNNSHYPSQISSTLPMASPSGSSFPSLEPSTLPSAFLETPSGSSLPSGEPSDTPSIAPFIATDDFNKEMSRYLRKSNSQNSINFPSENNL
jgi:hypothetical protein